MSHKAVETHEITPLTTQELSRIREEAMDFASVGIYRYRMDGTIVFIDAGALRLLDALDQVSVPSEMFGRNISDLLQYVEGQRSLRSLTLEHGSVRNLEYHFRTLKGEDRWVYHNAYLVRNAETDEPELQVLARDITDLKRTTLALAASERRLRTLIENSRQGLVVSSEEPPTVLLVNPAMLGMLGAEEAALLDRDVSVLVNRFHPEDREAAKACLTVPTRTAPDREGVELRLEGRDGRTIWVELLSSRIEFDGTPAIQTTVTDVTARLEADRQRQEIETRMHDAQRLESLGVLAGGIAHDFNNLLSAIMGNAELMRQQAQSDPDLATHVKEIAHAADRAADLCRQLLAYSGRKTLSKQPVDLNLLVEDAARLLDVTVSKRIQLVRELASGLPAIFADGSQVRQVLLNLITNASEALGDSPGRIVLRTGSKDLDRADLGGYALGDRLAPGRYIHFEVEDNGCGMADGIRSRIFEPFFTTKFTGRGLGLAAVRGIVQGHGGALKVETSVDHGTRIRVVFPASSMPVQGKAERQPPTQCWCGSGTILLADDEVAPRTVTARFVNRIGFDCVQAENGEEALRMFLEAPGRFNLVILDVVMPVMDGPCCFRALRQVRPDLPVLFVSGYDAESLKSDLMNEAVAFLQKPFRMDDLLDRVRALTCP
jgi:PAS domain S-box-containing protein